MPVIYADMRRASWGGANPGAFHPNGKLVWNGDQTDWHVRSRAPNPTEEDDSDEVDIPAIRFFIGFSVGSKPKWKMADLIRFVKDIRQRQGASADATFVAQTGMYSYRQAGKNKDTVVTEHGAQLVIMNMPYTKVSLAAFKQQMKDLGEELCRRLKQELIIGEWQINGLIKQTWRVTP